MKLSNSSLFSIVVSSFSWTAATAAPRKDACVTELQFPYTGLACSSGKCVDECVDDGPNPFMAGYTVTDCDDSSVVVGTGQVEQGELVTLASDCMPKCLTATISVPSAGTVTQTFNIDSDCIGVISDCPVRGDPDYGVAPCFAAPGWCTPPPEFKDYPVMDLSSRNSPLRDLGTWHPADDEDGPYYLTLEPGYFCGPNWKGPIQTFNGAFHGPTLEFYAGTNWSLIYENKMEDPLGTETDNLYKLPNSTNLHLHGAHTSPKSPGDNVKLLIHPGQSREYLYEFPLNHEPGNHWYHPHLHGSVAFQTGLGTAGIFIVKDPPGFLPPIYEGMEELHIILQEIDIKTTTMQAQTSGERLKNPETNPTPNRPVDADLTYMAPGNGYYWFNTTDFPLDEIIIEESQTAPIELENFIFVNGQYEPKITVEQGKWYRWRMVMSSTQDGIIFAAPDGCDLQLLGHDGIYLKDAPRSVEAFILPPGGRADVAMRCDISPGIYEMELLTKGRNYGRDSPINATQGATVPNEFRYDQSQTVVTNFPIIALLEVVAGSGSVDPSTLPSLSGLPKPCYLADLSEAPQPPQFWLAYGGSEAIKFINNGASGPVCDNNANFGLCVNGMGFNDKMYTNMYNMGDPQETFLVNNGGHPHHQHVNPFQLHMNNVTIAPFMLDDGARSININNYDMIGDWYDTLQHPGSSGPNTASLVRWVASDYNTINEMALREGKIEYDSSQIFHCHILSHEDQGMAGQDLLIGKEGTVWDGATDCMMMDEPLVPMPPTPAPPTPAPTPPPTPRNSPKKSKKNGPPPPGPPPPKF